MEEFTKSEGAESTLCNYTMKEDSVRNRDRDDSGIIEDLEDLDQRDQKEELALIKESMTELESVLESVKESVEDFVEYFGESEESWLKRENARLKSELNALRLSPEIVLNKLPEELWLQVLSYLPIPDLCQVSLVCRGFLHLSRDPSLWPHLSLLGDALADTDTICTLLARCTQLASISITARDDSAVLVKQLATHCPLLTRITVKYCPPLPYTALSCLTLGCPKLRTIDLESTGCLNGDCGDVHPIDCKCSCSSTVSFPLLLAGLSNLTKLNLFACRNLHSQGLQLLAETCVSLQSLNIDEVNYLSDDSVNLFLEMRGSGLIQLWIDGESLTDASFSNFHKMTQLELLSVYFCDSLGPAGLSSISRLGNLEWLRLRRGAELEPKHFVNSFDLGLIGSRLAYLDFSECSKLDDSGVLAIARNCPNLGTVSLNWCWEVTDIGLGHLVHRCPGLVSLGLCGVVRLQGDCLPGLDKLLPGLKLLDLEQCPDVGLAELQDLVRRNLSLVVRDYYGERVTAARDLQEFIIDHPEITFITYDFETEEDNDG